MFAKNAEILLYTLLEKSDVSPVIPDDFLQRFDSLRRYAKLPRGRERRAQILTTPEIAAAIFGLVPTNPKWAGHAAIILGNLRLVEGEAPSFFGTATLQQSIERILSDAAARESLVRVNLSLAERGINAHGYATLSFDFESATRQVSYGSQPDHLYSPASRAMTFNRAFFERVAREIARASAIPAQPAGDGSEYDAEEAAEQRYRRLGVQRGSQFLNIGVDNQVTWPPKEILIKFDKYQLVLMPKTRDDAASVHIDLATNRLSQREAETVINRFLSIMTWCDDQFAIAQDGWSGNPIPVPVPKRDLAFTTAYQWIFDRKIPAFGEAQRALALFREARNAQQNYMVSYAVLNFYSIIEIKHPGKEKVKKWFREKFNELQNFPAYKESIAQFLLVCPSDRPHEYLHTDCRVAIAHAGKDRNSDPDDVRELARLHEAAEILHVFARHLISTELGVSDSPYSGD
jgi:hypothetical protein